MRLTLEVKRRTSCALCLKEATCAHFPLDDDRPDNGLGPWVCKVCWESEMRKRRGRERIRSRDDYYLTAVRLSDGNPGFQARNRPFFPLRAMPWPKRARKPLTKKTENGRTIITVRDLLRTLPDEEEPLPPRA